MNETDVIKADVIAAIDKPYFTPQELADYLSVSVKTLCKWRHRSGAEYPRWVRVGSQNIAYLKDDVIAWLARKTAAPTLKKRGRPRRWAI
ncbi:MAG: hypothetical protein LBQ52_04550 [Helicobacteraceae bacterium]|jgi:predicted DNA-binding transcriptional regulator AlpA|nr:hypothetical protein [Helicobacteraceae bacterium]